MGNANTHERRKSGVPETGLTIEDIRAPAVLFQPAEAKEQSGSEAAVATGEGVAAAKTKTPPPSFETTGSDYTTFLRGMFYYLLHGAMSQVLHLEGYFSGHF